MFEGRKRTGAACAATLVVGLISVAMLSGLGCTTTPDPSPSPSPSPTPTPEPSPSPTPEPSPSPTPEPTGQSFAGAATCMPCHAETHTSWAATIHTGAFESLKAIGQDTNAECIGCHTVGYEAGGFVDEATTPEFVGVQCENCHGGAGEHTTNPGDASLRPSSSIASEVCGVCHTGDHHPTMEQWTESGHSKIDEIVAEDLIAGGFFVASCGPCHSGDVFYEGTILEGEVADDRFAGLTADDLTPITCVVCHDPHAQTNNAENPDEGRDYQLRYPQVVSVTPSDAIEDVTDTSRYNLCGQCHHSRGRDWTETSRAPHHSVQSNVYFGEMATSNGFEPLVASANSIHSFVSEQCSGCHMYRKDFETEEAPAISGHTFDIDYDGCAVCHNPDTDPGQTKFEELETEVQAALDDILARMETYDTNTTGEWEYSATGGPADQSTVPDELKQVRFLYSYIISDGSYGAHNPSYVRAMITKADELLTGLGL